VVLLVSPDDEERISFRRTLYGSNWELLECGSIREALAVLAHGDVSVIVCSTDHETGDWHELLDGLRTAPRPPRLVLCSRLADDRLWAEALNWGCYDVLLVPFSSEEVLRVLYLAWDSWRRSS
jgi:CheY-like chemotaxis protein